jgi:hypothetical protein
MGKIKKTKKKVTEDKIETKATTRAKKAIRNILVGKGGEGKALIDAGYSKAYAKNPKKFRNSKAYKEEVIPFLTKLLKERDRIIEAMSEKKLKKEQYFVLSNSLDKIVKNAELLAGRPTDNLNLIEIDENQFRQLNGGR